MKVSRIFAALQSRRSCRVAESARRRQFSTSSRVNARSIYAFGKGDTCPLGDATAEDKLVPTLVKGTANRPFVSVAAGWMQNFAILDNGELWGWGKNEHGQLGMPYNRSAEVDVPEQNMSFKKVKISRVAPGRCHTVFMTSDAIVLSCGNNEMGQLGIGIESDEARPAPQVVEILRGKSVVDVKVGLDHSVAVTADGRAWTWGFGPDGQLGFSSDENKPAPTMVPGINNAVSAACGLDHTIVVDGSGGYYAFGRNDMGQLGINEKNDFSPKPVKYELPGVKFTKIACGGVHSVGLSAKGQVYAWGAGSAGRLGTGSDQDQLIPTPIEYFMRKNITIVDIAVGGGHTLALSSDGRLFAWGFGTNGRLGLGDDMDRQEPTPVTFFDDKDVLAIACGLDHSLVIAQGA